jgi:hypothetical protein
MHSKVENKDRFIQYSKEMEIDWTTIKTKIKADKDREMKGNSQ